MAFDTTLARAQAVSSAKIWEATKLEIRLKNATLSITLGDRTCWKKMKTRNLWERQTKWNASSPQVTQSTVTKCCAYCHGTLETFLRRGSHQSNNATYWSADNIHLMVGIAPAKYRTVRFYVWNVSVETLSGNGLWRNSCRTEKTDAFQNAQPHFIILFTYYSEWACTAVMSNDVIKDLCGWYAMLIAYQPRRSLITSLLITAVQAHSL